MSVKDFFFHNARWQYDFGKRYDRFRNRVVEVLDRRFGSVALAETVELEAAPAKTSEVERDIDEVIIIPHGADKKTTLNSLRLPHA